MKRFAKPIGIAVALLAIAVVGLQFLPEMADIRDSVEAMHCRQNLEAVFPRLVEYGKLHDTFPTTPDGDLDLRAVYDALKIPESGRNLCTKNNQFDCYIFRKGLKPSDVVPEWETDEAWTIIAMDSENNHPIVEGSFAGQLRVNALFSCDASSLSLILTVAEFDMLKRKLQNGELFDNTILADDD